MKKIIYKIKRYYHFLTTGMEGWGSSWRYGHPEKKLKIITITGTDGKTTTSTLVYNLLKKAGYKVGLISTVGAYISNAKIDTGFHVTSPPPADLYRLMRKMVDEKMEYLVLEVTSQGAYQYRNWGIKAEIAGLTNIANEHLDYHLDFDNYLRAKALVLQAAKTVVLNDSQSYFNQIKKLLGKKVEVLTFDKQTRFSSALEKAVRVKVEAEYNRLNAYLALIIAKKLGIAEKDLISGIESFTLPEGRMQVIENRHFTTVVDFAHTPQALEAAATAIRKKYVPKGKILIGIVGAAGERDKQKRPQLGKILAEKCDIAVFTAEDPRGENIWAIINTMKIEVTPYQNRIVSIADRKEALRWAIKNYGKDGNVVAIFGKGHERSMNYDGITEIPWNDAEEARKIAARYS